MQPFQHPQAHIAYLETSLANVQDGIVWIDSAHQICWCNPAFAKLAHASTQHLQGQFFPDVFPLKQAGRSLDLDEYPHPARCSRVFAEYELALGGKNLVLEIESSSPAPNDQSLAVLTIRDVTESRRVTHEMLSATLLPEEQAASILQATLEATADGVLVMDWTQAIPVYNQKFLQMWSMPLELLAPERSKERVQWLANQVNDPQGFLSRIMDIVRNYRDVPTVDIVELTDGRVFERYSQPHWIRDEIVGRVWNFRDITARVQAEEALKIAKEAAEAANQAKSVFLANMSHELRTPLNAILGFAQLMERDPQLSPQQKESLATINRSGEHLLNLINDVLQMSKIEAGHINLHLTAFDLTQLLQTLRSMFQLRADAKHLLFQFVIAPNVPTHVQADEGKLRQVLINLIGNAIKFTPSGYVKVSVAYQSMGEISPHPFPQIANSSTLEHGHLRFEVSDTGAGIAADEVEQLFQPFVQAHAGTKAQEGTGLGLSISQKYVQLMGGNIQLESTPGQGSCFWFSIPVQVHPVNLGAPVSSLKRVLSLAPNQPEFRILVVDDYPENCAVLVQLLRPVGFSVRVAYNGQEAISVWQAWQPHLIWMDMRMPVMDGYVATQRIRTLEAELEADPVVIVAFTASVFQEQQTRILEIGCNDLVCKPFQEQQVFTKMADYLGVEYLYSALDSQGAAITVEPMAESSSQALERLSSLSPGWVDGLCQAALAVDADQVRSLIHEIEPTQARLASQLTTLLHSYDFDQILDLAESLQESHAERKA